MLDGTVMLLVDGLDALAIAQYVIIVVTPTIRQAIAIKMIFVRKLNSGLRDFSESRDMNTSLYGDRLCAAGVVRDLASFGQISPCGGQADQCREWGRSATDRLVEP